MLLVVALAGILALFVLIAFVRLNAFIAFLLVGLGVGLAAGQPALAVVASLERGLGGTLGALAVVLGLGAMLGKLVADSGAARRITDGLVAAFGPTRVQWAVMVAGFIVGIPMFYTVGFVVLVPLVFAVAAATRLPLLSVGLPLLAALSVTHGYLPPHPAPTGIAVLFGADIGRTLLLGILVALPAIAVAGPVLARVLPRVATRALEEFVAEPTGDAQQLPSLAVSLATALLPVGLIGGAAGVRALAGADTSLGAAAGVIGEPTLALLITVLVAIYTLGLRRGRRMPEVMATLGAGLEGITLVLFVIAGAGAFKEVLVDVGVSDYLGGALGGLGLSPLLLAWVIATVIRVCVGSATVAGLTAAGIVEPLVASSGASPELMVLAIGSGSLMLSHVNDGGFWLFKEYFGVSVRDTLRTWTVMETAVGIMGLLGVLVLDGLRV